MAQTAGGASKKSPESGRTNKILQSLDEGDSGSLRVIKEDDDDDDAVGSGEEFIEAE